MRRVKAAAGAADVRHCRTRYPCPTWRVEAERHSEGSVVFVHWLGRPWLLCRLRLGGRERGRRCGENWARAADSERDGGRLWDVAGAASKAGQLSHGCQPLEDFNIAAIPPFLFRDALAAIPILYDQHEVSLPTLLCCCSSVSTPVQLSASPSAGPSARCSVDAPDIHSRGVRWLEEKRSYDVCAVGVGPSAVIVCTVPPISSAEPGVQAVNRRRWSLTEN